MGLFGHVMAETRCVRRSLVLLAVSLPACFPCAAIGADVNRAAITDPVSDPAFPATAAAIVVPSRGVGMNAQFYLAAGPGPHPTMLLKIDASHVQTTIMPTDHIFSDRRIELASTLLDWLGKLSGH